MDFNPQDRIKSWRGFRKEENDSVLRLAFSGAVSQGEAIREGAAAQKEAGSRWDGNPRRAVRGRRRCSSLPVAAETASEPGSQRDRWTRHNGAHRWPARELPWREAGARSLAGDACRGNTRGRGKGRRQFSATPARPWLWKTAWKWRRADARSRRLSSFLFVCVLFVHFRIGDTSSCL